MADFVDLVGDPERRRKNRIQPPYFLNQNCAPDSLLESILLNFPRQNIYQRYRSLADAIS
jgi:hypothetical protein